MFSESVCFLCLCLDSKLLYELYKSSEQEVASNDEEECNHGKMNSVLKILVENVCQKCHVPNVIVTSRLVQEFKSKIWRLNQSLTKAKTQGGNGMRKLFAKWSNGKYSTWSFKIYYNELDCARLQNENTKLTGLKRKLENDLEEERAKKSKIEKKLKEAVSQNKEITVEVFNENTNEYETITLVDEENIRPSSQTEVLTDEDIDEIHLLLYSKERFNVSNEAYHELSMICKDLPRSWKVHERIKALNSKWNLSNTPGDTCGVQQSIKERLEIRLQSLIKNTPTNSAFKHNRKIQVKLTGDGTNIGKRLHVINVTFTILDEGAKAMAADGNHLVAIIKVTENYDKLAIALADIRKDVESLKHVSVGTECFAIEWFLGGDWKFLACICGLGAATAIHPCIWCKCPLYDKYDERNEWSLHDKSKGARSIEEMQQQLNIRSRSGERYNVKHSPLFPSIPLDHVVIDSLHLFLRISDTLINLLILELQRQDAVDKKKKFNDGFERSKYKHMAGWETYLNDTLKIPFNWFVCKDSKKLKWRDLTGPEKQKLFRNINISRVAQSSEIWPNFTAVETISYNC
ncbi:hypothetical protein ACROYT_G022824 [Oculina patagonica]